jgi:hypothetical protein
MAVNIKVILLGCEAVYCTLNQKIGAGGSSETLIPFYQTTQHHTSKVPVRDLLGWNGNCDIHGSLQLQRHFLVQERT